MPARSPDVPAAPGTGRVSTLSLIAILQPVQGRSGRGCLDAASGLRTAWSQGAGAERDLVTRRGPLQSKRISLAGGPEILVLQHKSLRFGLRAAQRGRRSSA